MDSQDAGHFFDIRSRLTRQLAHLHWSLGKPFTPNQEAAWKLLAELGQMVQIFEQVARYLPGHAPGELVYQVEHTLLMHRPKWKSNPGGTTESSGPQELCDGNPPSEVADSSDRQD